MNDQKLMRAGVIGTLVAALCCFTPVLVVLFGFAGLSAYIGGLDYGLFPLLFASMGMLAYALYLRSGRPGPSPKFWIVLLVIGISLLLFWLQFRYALRISIAAALMVALYAGYLRSVRSPT